MSVRRIVASTRSVGAGAIEVAKERLRLVSGAARCPPGPPRRSRRPAQGPPRRRASGQPLRNVGGLPRLVRRAVQHERGHAEVGKHVGDVAVHDHALERDRCARARALAHVADVPGCGIPRRWCASACIRGAGPRRTWARPSCCRPRAASRATRRRFAPTGSPATGDPSATGRKGRAQSSASDRWRRREWPGASPRVRRGERRTPPPRRPSRHGRRPSAPRASGRFGAGSGCARPALVEEEDAPEGRQLLHAAHEQGLLPDRVEVGRGHRVRRRGRAAPRRAPGRRC